MAYTAKGTEAPHFVAATALSAITTVTLRESPGAHGEQRLSAARGRLMVAPMQYLIREQNSLLSRELSIEDHQGHALFRVHGPLVRLRDELRLDDPQGVEQAWIKDPVLGASKAYEIYRGGAHVADVRMIGVGNLLEGYDVEMRGGGQSLHARGDMFGRDYTITRQGQRAAKVKRHDGNTIEVETEGAQDEVLLLASVVAMGAMTDIWARAGSKKD